MQNLFCDKETNFFNVNYGFFSFLVMIFLIPLVGLLFFNTHVFRAARGASKNKYHKQATTNTIAVSTPDFTAYKHIFTICYFEFDNLQHCKAKNKMEFF